MIVQCEQCRTKFRLDDGKVSDRGVRVRCAKCRHVFTVRKPETSLQPAGIAEPAAMGTEMPTVEDVWAPAQETAEATVQMASAAEPEAAVQDDLSAPAMAIDFGAASPGADAFEHGQPESAPGAAGFGEIDFGELPPSQQEADNLGAFAVAPPVAEESFGLGDIDFGADASAVADAQPVAEPAAIAEMQTPEAGATEGAPVPDISFDEPASKDEREAPPLSISSRRRQSPLLSILLTVLGLLVVGVAGFMGYSHFSDSPDGFKLFEKSRVPVEEGRITVRKISATYLEQTAAGELLVISGEAVNNFTKTRAALQLKGIVFGGDGSELVSKVAYAGNTLTHEQLLTMPLDKIEAAMNNQFGDSLINLEVQPGKAIPFTLVIVNPPKDGREFGVEAVGSTVAASK